MNRRAAAILFVLACKKHEPYAGAPKVTLTAHGAVTELAAGEDDVIWFCDARGARTIDAHGSDVASSGKCPSAPRASTTRCVKNGVTLTETDGGQLVSLGGHQRIAYESSQVFPRPVLECDRDGDWLLIANADGVYMLDARDGPATTLDTSGAKYAVTTTRWYAWSDGATVHFSRHEAYEP